MGERVCGGRRPGATSAGWPGTSEKPTPAIVQEDPGRGPTRWEPKSSALDCVSEMPRPSASMRAQVRGVPVAQAGRRRGPIVPRGRARRRAAPAVRADPGGRRGQPPRSSSRAVAVGAVVEHGGAVVPDGAPRLHQEVGPLRVVRVGPEPGRLGHRRHRPTSGSPATGAARSTARGPRPARSGVHQSPCWWRSRPARNGRRRAPAGPGRTHPGRSRRVRRGRWRAACGRCPGSAHGLPDAERAVRAELSRRRGGRGRDGWPAPA